jgi:hypothetical protein
VRLARGLVAPGVLQHAHTLSLAHTLYTYIYTHTHTGTAKRLTSETLKENITCIWPTKRPLREHFPHKSYAVGGAGWGSSEGFQILSHKKYLQSRSAKVNSRTNPLTYPLLLLI